MTGVARQALSTVQSHAKAMEAGFCALEAADKELGRLLQECAARVFAKDDRQATDYLREHKRKRDQLRQQFFESSRAIEFTIEQAKCKSDRISLKTEVEAEIDRLVPDIDPRGQRFLENSA